MKRNIWHAVENYPEILIGQYVVPNFVSNSVSIQISETEYILYSPGESLLDVWPYKDIDKVKVHIIMPNAYHFMGVKAWCRKLANVSLYTSKLALSQLHEKKAFTKTDAIHVLETSELPLPSNYQLLFPPGHRAGDVWLKKFQVDTSLWITCDSFLNYDRLSNQPIARLLQKALGAAPGLKMSQVVKWFILKDRLAFKQWALEQVRMDKPTALIPSHGELRQSNDLSQELINLLESRL